jgi:hypothetical protein
MIDEAGNVSAWIRLAQAAGICLALAIAIVAAWPMARNGWKD